MALRTPGGEPGERVLFVLRALGMGDLLVAVPALRALRRAYPAHRMVLGTTPALHGLAALIGGIDEMTPATGPTDFVAPRIVDVAVNLHGAGPQSRDALVALRPQTLLSHDARGLLGPPWDTSWLGHERERWAAFLDRYGISCDPDDLRLRRPEMPPTFERACIVHPGAAFAARRWPAARFAAVAAILAEHAARVVVTGSAAESALAQDIAHAAGLPPESVVTTLDAVGLASLVAHARLVVCGDTGPAHLAAALGTASVVLFGPTPPERWGPPNNPRHVALWRGDTGYQGDPWGTQPDPCLLALKADEVAAQALSLLGVDRSPEPCLDLAR